MTFLKTFFKQLCTKLLQDSVYYKVKQKQDFHQLSTEGLRQQSGISDKQADQSRVIFSLNLCYTFKVLTSVLLLLLLLNTPR